MILSIIANLHALFTVTLKPDGDSYECSADDSYEQLVFNFALSPCFAILCGRPYIECFIRSGDLEQ